MLQVTETPAFVNTSPRLADAPNHSVRAMTRRRLGKILREASATDRALLAYTLVHGAVQLVRPTRVQVAALTKASLGYIDTITHLSEDARLRVAKGQLSLSHLYHRQKPTDAALDHVVERYGAEALWRALDRATATSSDNVAINRMAAK